MNEAKQTAVGVGERQHQPPGLVRDIQIHPHLEAVHKLEREAKCEEHEQRPPAEPYVPADVDGDR